MTQTANQSELKSFKYERPAVLTEPKTHLFLVRTRLLGFNIQVIRDGGETNLHAHPGLSTWRYGIDPDREILPRGTTTVLSQGDAGAHTWPLFLKTFIEGSKTRVKLAISPSVKGELEDRGCFVNLHEIDVDACVRTIEEGNEHIWGVAANLTAKACGDNDPREVMRRTLEIAERTHRPILYGPRREPSDWPLAEQLKLLRPGDVFTYCFHSDHYFGNSTRKFYKRRLQGPHLNES